MIYKDGTSPEKHVLPRRYTLTHSDRTGELLLTISNQYDTGQISGIYTRFMRDEILAELKEDGGISKLILYCHISGGFVLGNAKWRYNIFKSELPLVLEAIRYGDRAFFEHNSHLDHVPVLINFQSTKSQFNKVEPLGKIEDYR